MVTCCRAALQFYRRTDDVSNDMEEMDTEFQQQRTTTETAAGATGGGAEKTSADSSFTLAQLLLTAGLRRPLFVACMLQVIQQFSGINAVSLALLLFLFTWNSFVFVICFSNFF